MITKDRIRDIAYGESSEWATSLLKPEHCDVLGGDIMDCIITACQEQEKATLLEIAEWLEEEGNLIDKGGLQNNPLWTAANQLRARVEDDK